jgi:hypothetical protein
VTSNRSFVRKVTYIVVIVLLLIPLSLMSQPATMEKDSGGRLAYNPGGVLAEMRRAEGLSQTQLGEIDPASETMKLATFGMRGVAVVLLWEQANDAKKKEAWDRLSATLEQIARLQPNFVTVWEHQAHNLAYNVSVEFDDYRQRYHWVKKGIDYLIDGTTYNRDNPRLLWYAGWVVGQKMGRSDERKQFREMFRDDTELHNVFARQQIDIEAAKGADGKPDNWLVGRLWYLKGQEAVDQRGKPLGGKSPALFHSSPIMSRINYFSDSEKEPNFDEARVRAEARLAGEEWFALGNRPLLTSFGFNVQLNNVERLEAIKKELEAKLDELAPGVREAIRAEKLAALPADFRRAFEKPAEERSVTEQPKAAEVEKAIHTTPLEIAARAPVQKSIEAKRIAQRLNGLQDELRLTHSSRQVVNYEFWAARCASGADELNSRARRHLFEAKQLFERTDLEGAKEKFEQSWHEWAGIFKKWPVLLDDAENQELATDIEAYVKVLDQLDLRDASGGILPADFPLAELLRRQGKEGLLQFRSDEEEKKEEKPREEEPKSDESKSEEPKSEEPKSEEPKSDEPKSEEPKSEEPKSEEPKSEEPKSEESQAAEPAAEAAKSDQPQSEEAEAAPATENP